MIIKPKIRGFICTTAHPAGCAKNIEEQIKFVKGQSPIENGPKKALIIGASTGYGLSSRVVSAFGGSQASTIGVFFEKESEGARTATAGWYNSVAFEEEAKKHGLYANSFNGDAYSDEMKQKVVEAVKNDLGGVDLIVYSLASPRRIHPKTGKISKSVLKPIVDAYSGNSIDLSKDRLETVTLNKASEEEIEQTVAVMGGEDWQFWIDALEKEKLLMNGVKTVAYSYVGPEVTQPVYRNGTIGKAKEHLEATAGQLNQRLQKYNGKAVISVNKALVTQSSSAIPFIPLYFIILSKVMKEKNINESCIEQIYRLFASKLYTKDGNCQVDENGLIRMDDHEMLKDVQDVVNKRWKKLNDENLRQLTDLDGYHEEFLKLFGFGFDDVDYEADVNQALPLPSSKLQPK